MPGTAAQDCIPVVERQAGESQVQNKPQQFIETFLKIKCKKGQGCGSVVNNPGFNPQLKEKMIAKCQEEKRHPN